MIAWGRVLLLVACFMFLVHDDQSQSPERKEYRGTDSQYHVVTLFGQLFLPDFHPFRIRKLGVIYS